LSRLTIGPPDAGQRLDRFLRKLLPAAGLGEIFGGLRRGEVRVNGARARPDQRLRAGDVVDLGPGLIPAEARPGEGTVELPGALPPAGLRVVHLDADLLAVDKPAGLALHPGSGVREHLLGLVHAWLGEGRGHTFRVAAAHRLDRATSGLVVFGLSPPGLRGFTAMLRSGAVAKTYLALVHGAAPERGTIDLALRRLADRPSGPRMCVDEGGDPATSSFECLAVRGPRSLLAVRPATGRTHQLRVHLAAVGMPIVGDRRYGRSDGAARLFLHAWRLAFPHPSTGAPLVLEAPPPPELRPP